MPLITARALTKRFQRPRKEPGLSGALRHIIRPNYEEKVALDAIDLAIEPGEMVGYVGPNGAGKSTTVKLLTGILVPSSGQVRVDGHAPHHSRIAIANRIGVVFGQRTQLWWDLPVQESFRLLGDLYQVSAQSFARTLAECVELLELGPLLRTPARQLSLGQRMRCDLAAALLHAPPILFLDEPTIGLDVAVKARIRSFIKTIQRERGVTILLTSHDLGDIADLCRRLVMLDQGRIVFDGPLDMITARFGRDRVVHLLLSEALPDAAATARAALPEILASAITQPEPHRLAIAFDAAQITAGAIAGRIFAQLPVADLRIEEPTIETIIGRLYTGALRYEEAAP
jgi:ABC-2 type transport system ATP-binding protein